MKCEAPAGGSKAAGPESVPGDSDLVPRSEDLVVDCPIARRQPVRAVDHVGLETRAGEIGGIGGESGSGKSIREDGMALFFISHDSSVLAPPADRVVVMHDAEAVGSGPAREAIDDPQDGCTARLIASVSSPERVS